MPIADTTPPAIQFRYKVLRLSQLPGQAVLDSGSVGLLPFAPLMQPPAVRRLADQIAAIDDVQRLKQLHRAAIEVPSLEAFRNLLDTDE